MISFQQFVGVLSRENLANALPLSAGFGENLQILVENQGRINFAIANDFKGIIGDAYLGNDHIEPWNITGFSFENERKLTEYIASVKEESSKAASQPTENLINGPIIFHGSFDINETDIVDTYIDPSGWGKVKMYKKTFR